MSPNYQVTWINRLFRSIIRPVFRVVFRVIGRVEVRGLENVPKSGPYLIVFNHVSIVDPPFLVAYWPTDPEILGAVDVWSRPGQDLLARLYGGIPIRRGEVDRAAMDGMLTVLRSGRPLLVAPEGGRSHEPGLRQAKAGVVFLIERTNVPVVPVGIVGTTDKFIRQAFHFERPQLNMTVGEPFTLPEVEAEGLSPKEARQQKADFIMQRISDLLPPHYQGVYASSQPGQRSIPHPII